jgi:hypothetical protein
MKPLLLATFAVLGCAVAGCGKAEEKARSVAPRTTDLGTGLNAVERTLPRAAGDLIDNARNALASFDLKLKSDLHDALGGELTAVRADGHTVTAKITAVDEGHARVSVWVAPGDRSLAELIQQRIAEKAGVESRGP